jgi:hypothetical protein
MNPDLLSGDSIQNSYPVHEASGPFARNPIPSLPTTREGGREEGSEGERRASESARSAWNSFDLRLCVSRESSILSGILVPGICLFGRFRFY